MATAPQGQAGGSEKKLQPIIIKRVKKSAHGVHGGAWKIAYADFVTAMMAFFLLMWLLGSTAKGDLQGIAAYFNSPLKVAMQGGDGAGNSSSIIPGGGTDLARISGQVKRSDADADTNRRRDIGSAMVKPYMRVILREVGAALGGVENRISLAGHTDAAPYGNGERGYSNWELSTDRANASRRELVSAGMPDDKLARVVGLSSMDLLLPDQPRAPQNRRITITVLTREAEERLLGKNFQPVTQQTDVPEVLTGQTPDNRPFEPATIPAPIDAAKGPSAAPEAARP